LVTAMKQTHALFPTIFTSRPGISPVSFDEQAWGELPTARVVPGQLAVPVQLEPGKNVLPATALGIHADEAQKNTASWEQSENTWILSFETGGGWGLHGDLALEQLELKGTQEIKLELEAPAGTQLQILLHETGDGPPGGQVYKGEHGADGESYELPEFTATGARQIVRFRLADAERRVYWGNQSGNLILDTQGLRAMSFLIRSGQGKGQLRIYRIRFLGAGQV
jgi:hypothetical protein